MNVLPLHLFLLLRYVTQHPLRMCHKRAASRCVGRVGSLVLQEAAEANTDVARSLRLGKQQGCFFSRDDDSWF